MNDAITLFLHWQDPVTRRWHIVGRLTRSDDLYKFVYTKGAIASKRFIPFGRMTSLFEEYRSPELFPLFNNRILQRSRPEFKNYLDWLDVDSANPDPLLLLSRSGGLRGTDTLGLYPMPMPDQNNMYRVLFFCHGLRYVPDSSQATLQGLRPGALLYPMHDMQNEWDRNALALRTRDPVSMIGYCPRYFAKDFRVLLRRRSKEAGISVRRINRDAPIEFRLLCEFHSPWPIGFKACQDNEYEPLNGGPYGSQNSVLAKILA
jgi:hypothetical protein